MTGFITKELKSLKSLPELIRQERERLNLTLERLSLLSGVSIKYLEILELGEYQSLPSNMYARQFIKAISEVLKLSYNHLLKLYEQEKSSQLILLAKVNELDTHQQKLNFINPKNLRLAGLTVVIVSLCAYLGWQVNSIFAAPSLTIMRPVDQLTTSDDFLEIIGQTQPESNVTINDQEIIIQPDGQFKQTVNLNAGLNNFTISAAKKHSKKSQVNLSILKSQTTTQADNLLNF